MILVILGLLCVWGLVRWLAPGDNRGNSAEAQAVQELRYTDYNGKPIGILAGTNMEQESFEHFPESEYIYFDGYPNLNTALVNGVIDAYLGDEPALKSIHASQPQISYLPERLTHNSYSFAFRKNDEKERTLRDDFNRFLAGIREDGTLAEIDAVWFGDEEDKKVVDMSDLTGENGTIRVVTTSTDEPFSYIKDGKNVGYDIDVVVRYCRSRGYALELGEVAFQARIPALASGRYEFTTSMNVTPEREEEVLFSDPVSEGGIVAAVRTADLAGGGSEALSPDEADSGNPVQRLLGRIQTGFEKNFIRESRWKLILSGISTTCIITALAVLAGTVLAFLVCLLRRTGSRLAGLLCDIYVKLLQGTPIVVVLMLLYYVIFRKPGISAVGVAAAGFALNFGAYVSEILRSGIAGIDPGQEEAALALGFTEREAFFRFILPQAVRNILPVYRGEIIGLLKSTSVVGYIGIQDLTRMSDIIRSRTYDAFFPLAATAALYFLLAWLTALLLDTVLKMTDPREKKRGREGKTV